MLLFVLVIRFLKIHPKEKTKSLHEDLIMNSCVLALCLRNSEVQSKGMFQLTFLCSYDIYVCVCVCVCVYSFDPMEPARLLCPWNFPGKNTGVSSHVLLQGIFPTQGSNPGLLCLVHCRWIFFFFFYHCATLEARIYVRISRP